MYLTHVLLMPDAQISVLYAQQFTRYRSYLDNCNALNYPKLISDVNMLHG